MKLFIYLPNKTMVLTTKSRSFWFGRINNDFYSQNIVMNNMEKYHNL